MFGSEESKAVQPDVTKKKVAKLSQKWPNRQKVAQKYYRLALSMLKNCVHHIQHKVVHLEAQLSR